MVFISVHAGWGNILRGRAQVGPGRVPLGTAGDGAGALRVFCSLVFVCSTSFPLYFVDHISSDVVNGLRHLGFVGLGRLASYRSWSGHHRILRAFKLHRGVQQHLHVLGGLLHELPLVPVVGEEIKLMI